MIGILIFAVDARLRRTLEQLPRKDPAITIVGIADDQPSLVRLAERSHVDVVLTQKLPTVEQIADWRIRYDNTAWVFFLDPADRRAALDALGAGASAISPPSADLGEIVATIRMVAEGLVVFPQQLLAALLSRAEISNGQLHEADEDHHPRLSKREIAVLTAMTDGLSNKEIARRLEISFHTVKFHVASILEKLEVETRTEAVFKAAQLGIVML
jgi:two-component system, NarL family, response regulator YdfI